ncbi:MAG: hypothetical protein CMB31_04305 [Euryarchaeota archaeon]|nr:hypothetical protein [Euryarchaeota archaeon]|tara:strand:+ start:65 stop:442 length:378 start_codon:yes stop_codon:yes gene_type:complete
MFHNGLEYYIINPFSEEISQKTQELYIFNYNEAYFKMINSLMIPEPLELFDKNTDTFIYYTDCSGDMDIINNNTEYEFKFLKSKFFEKKTNKLKKDLNIYYSRWNIKVNGIHRDRDIYYIELLKF